MAETLLKRPARDTRSAANKRAARGKLSEAGRGVCSEQEIRGTKGSPATQGVCSGPGFCGTQDKRGTHGMSSRPAGGGKLRNYTRLLVATGLALLLGLALDCGYTASPTLSSSIKRIYIPTFENETIRYGIEQDLTQAVAEAFTADNRLTVVSESDADVMLRGVIMKYEKGAFTFDRASSVEEFRVSISISVALEDLKEGKVIWEDDTMNAWEAYEESEDATTSEEEATAKVYVTLASDIVSRTLEGW